MASNEALVLSAANLETIENNIGTLAKNLGDVNFNVSEVDGKVNSVTESVKTIEDEIKNFMVEIRGSTIVSNAKQSITMDQDEINKQYGHYDSVRRKINGIFQATDINSVKKSTIENISEQVIIDTPNYWLAPALVSLCAWLTDNKDLANRALKEAMNRDDEKTSLLFCLIHLRAGRNETSLRWLRRYLDMQDPTKMENKTVTILDAITNGTFSNEAKEMILQKINQWSKELDAQPSYSEIQVDRWSTYLNSFIENDESLNFYYLSKYTNQHENILKILNFSKSEKNILNGLKDIIKEEKGPNISKSQEIDKIINMLVFNYENDELDLRKDIAKNRLIIEENGNVTKAMERFKETEFAYQSSTDFYSILSNIVLEYKNVKPTVNTRKLSMALEKEFIKEAYLKTTNQLNDNLNIEIKINNWTNNTIDGSNERELIQDLNNFIDNETNNDIYGTGLFDTKMLLITMGGLLLASISFILSQVMIGLLLIVAVLIADGYLFYVNYSARETKIKKREERKNYERAVLYNIIAEVVDYKFMYKESTDTHKAIINFLDSLDYHNYIKSTDNNRNIQVGGSNGQ